MWKVNVMSIQFRMNSNTFLDIDNSFQGGMFHKVRYLMMLDTRPFEHILFQLISQDFIYLEYLYVYNDQPQKNKQHLHTMITFPHLTFLHLQLSHVDYAEQFLLKKNTHLPCLSNLCIKCELLAIVTNNFTNDTSTFNFTKVKKLDISESFVRPENFRQYFPLL